ncbi:MAG: hypothetical protein HYU41_24405 [Candidatus Rokubacteria bacterium]|nr:hypothetical protein [Candidatus Rokubacteria bacterium]
MRPLTEVQDVRQVPGEPRRRWFESPDFDLVVWWDASGAPEAFQLCYDKTGAEHALTWHPGSGTEHAAVDTGDRVGLGHKRAPTLVADGHVDLDRVRQRFIEASGRVPPDIVAFVCAQLGDDRAAMSQPSPAQP